MKSKEHDTIAETRVRVWNRAGGMCEVCGEDLSWATFQMAHRIPQRKWLLKKYGKEVIHHHMNLAATCSLRCNNAVSIAAHPVEISSLVEQIQEAICGE